MRVHACTIVVGALTIATYADVIDVAGDRYYVTKDGKIVAEVVHTQWAGGIWEFTQEGVGERYPHNLWVTLGRRGPGGLERHVPPPIRNPRDYPNKPDPEPELLVTTPNETGSYRSPEPLWTGMPENRVAYRVAIFYRLIRHHPKEGHTFSREPAGWVRETYDGDLLEEYRDGAYHAASEEFRNEVESWDTPKLIAMNFSRKEQIVGLIFLVIIATQLIVIAWVLTKTYGARKRR